MKKKLVFKAGSEEMRIPLFKTLVIWMLLDYINAGGWLWGVVGTLFGLIWLAWIISFFHEEVIDLNGEEAPPKLRKWADRLEEIQRRQRGVTL